MPRTPAPLETMLQAALQQSSETAGVEEPAQRLPVKLDYELKHIALPGEDLQIALAIKPSADFIYSVYAVKVPDAFEVEAPLQTINLGRLKAGEIYHQDVWVKPRQEGLFAIKIFLVVETKGGLPQLKLVSIPISVGPFLKSPVTLQ